MNNRILIIAAALAVATTLIIGWLLLKPEQVVDGPGEFLDVLDESATKAFVDLDEEGSASTDGVVDSRPAEIERMEPSGNQEFVDGKIARVYGRFVLPNGTPAEGVKLRLLGWSSNKERVREHGLPLFWVDPSTTTDEEGRFEFSFTPPPAFQFAIDATLDGFAKESWRWSGILDGEEKDLGTIELVQCGIVIVTVKDVEGKVMKSGWTVYADSANPGGDAGRDRTSVHVAIDPATGSARLTGLPPGLAKLKASSRMAGWLEGPTVDVTSGKEVEAEILYSGPDNSKRIVVSLWQFSLMSGFPFPEIDERSILISSDGFNWRASKQHQSRSYSFDDLHPGLYTVKIEDERYDPWEKGYFVPGQRVKAVVRSNAALKVSVVDAVSCEQVEQFDLQIFFGRERLGPNTTRGYNDLCDLPSPSENGLITGIPPRIDSTLIVKAKGYAVMKIPLGVLSPKETRTLEARMRRGTEVRGIVLFSDGKTPVAGAEVELRPVGEPFEYCLPGYWSIEDNGAPDFMAVTDESGKFRITDVLPGTWSLHAYANEWLLASIEKLVVAEGADQEGLQILLPPASFLQGRLIGKPGFSFEGMHLIVKPSTEPVMEGFYADDEVELELSAEGVFQSGPLPSGNAVLSLRSSGVRPGDHPSRVVLADVILPAGLEKNVEIDLGEHRPGSIRVHVSRNGSPLSGHLVAFTRSGSGTKVVTGTDGVAVSTPLFPGAWTVSVRRTEYGGWRYIHSESVIVEAGKESECFVDVLVIAGRIRILDAETGKPLTSRRVWWAMTDGTTDSCETDADGWLDVTLAPGDYTFSAEYSRNREKWESLSWTSAGPTLDEIKLKASKDG